MPKFVQVTMQAPKGHTITATATPREVARMRDREGYVIMSSKVVKK